MIGEEDAKLITANGAANHVHLLISLGRKIDFPELVGDIKRDTSKWIKKQDEKFDNFYWQKGYGVFSIGQPQVETICKYIKNQKAHHAKRSFQDEYRLPQKYEIEYDERYVWD